MWPWVSPHQSLYHPVTKSECKQTYFLYKAVFPRALHCSGEKQSNKAGDTWRVAEHSYSPKRVRLAAQIHTQQPQRSPHSEWPPVFGLELWCSHQSVCVCVCAHHIYAGVHTVQKIVSDPLKPGLLVVLNHHVVARNLSQFSAKAISTLNHWAISPVTLINTFLIGKPTLYFIPGLET